MIDLTDLQEDILTLAVENPDMTNEEIADVLDCSSNWVSEVRRKFEHNVDESQIDGDLNTIRGNADTATSGSGGLFDLFVIAPLELSVRFTIWLLEVSVKLSLWMLEVGIALMLWLIELPFRILGAGSGSSKKDD